MAYKYMVEPASIKRRQLFFTRTWTEPIIKSVMKYFIAVRFKAYLLTLTALCLCGCAELHPQGAVNDPSIARSHALCGPYDFNWNGTSGRVYHPRGGDCSAAVYSPLVVIFHAAGADTEYSFKDYNYLQQHLAHNGFISVSVDVEAISTSVSDQLAAAQEAWEFVVNYLWSTWPKRFYINPGSISIIGHSRGGATARYLAQNLENSPVFHVKSVVSLAPASADDFLTGKQARGYLSIYGTKDGDTLPNPTFNHYDRAGSDDSQRDPGLNAEVLHKALKLVGQASHKGFSDLESGIQNDLTKGYVLAFLKQHNADDATWYENYIRSNAVPAGWPEDVFTQYSDGSYRRVIDHFDDGNVTNTTLGGQLTTFSATAQVLNLGNMQSTDVHNTHVLWTWGSPDGAAVTWSIPESKRDASDFKWLSLRIGQASGQPATDLRIQIRNNGEWSPEVRLTDHGSITQPMQMCWGGLAAVTCEVRRQMATVRVPLAAFTGHDNIDFVRIRFRGDSIADTFIIDNLEFSEWIYESFRTEI